MQDAPAPLHATAVVHRGAGLLIIGRSGSGKSSLALELMSRGAELVADDRVQLQVEAGALIALCPPAIWGQIEARHIGLLHAATMGRARLSAVVDLDRTESDRLPEARQITLMGVHLPLLYKVDSPVFAASLLQYLAYGRAH